MNLAQTVRKGDCECCDRTNVDVTLLHNMLMCDACLKQEQDATAKVVIDKSRALDAKIELKQDIFNAETIASAELKAAIDNDDSIPADQKDYAFTNECMTRMQHFQRVAFEKRKEVIEADNAAKMWQVNAQSAAGKLRPEIRETLLKSLNVNYQPVTPKTVKPKPIKTPSTSKSTFKIKELKDACEKYGVDMAVVRIRMTRMNMDAETAARTLAALQNQ